MMSWVEQMIADLVDCLNQDPLKYNPIHDAHFNAGRNNCIGGVCADAETKQAFFKIIFERLNPAEYRHFQNAFMKVTFPPFPGSGKYETYTPVMPEYGQILPRDKDFCIYAEDVFKALRLTFN